MDSMAIRRSAISKGKVIGHEAVGTSQLAFLVIGLLWRSRSESVNFLIAGLAKQSLAMCKEIQTKIKIVLITCLHADPVAGLIRTTT